MTEEINGVLPAAAAAAGGAYVVITINKQAVDVGCSPTVQALERWGLLAICLHAALCLRACGQRRRALSVLQMCPRPTQPQKLSWQPGKHSLLIVTWIFKKAIRTCLFEIRNV